MASDATAKNVRQILIADRAVGDHCPVFIIAEAGVNHDGHETTAHELIEAAAAAGADAVKFQAFDPAELCSVDAPLPDYAAAEGGSQREMLERLHLPIRAFRDLADHAAQLGLCCFHSVFDEKSLLELDGIKPVAYKFASTELLNFPLLLAAAQRGRPLLVSTGAARWDEIEAAVRLLQDFPLLLFHCVSSYPTSDVDAHLATIAAMRRQFPFPIGYSDHTLGDEAAPLAVAAGACAVEKHLTLDRSRPGPDHRLSLEPAQFREFVRRIRSAEAMLGSARVASFECEVDVRTKARKSIFLRESLPVGHVLELGDVALRRPGSGLGPEELPNVLGRPLKRGVAANQPLSREDV